LSMHDKKIKILIAEDDHLMQQLCDKGLDDDLFDKKMPVMEKLL
jgi:hypothetical protein